MKPTGIIRRIDDLGRIVIPKKIRETYGIKEGDAFEVYTTMDGDVMFKKYDATPNREKEAEAWLRGAKPAMDSHHVRFFIEGDTTTCEGIADNQRLTGTAKRDPKDPFSPAVGMIWAYCRAFGIPLPEFLA